MGKLVAQKLQNRSDLDPTQVQFEEQIKFTEEQLDNLAKVAATNLNSLPPSSNALQNFAGGALNPQWENQEQAEVWGNPRATPLEDIQKLQERLQGEVFYPTPNPFKLTDGDTSHQWNDPLNREQVASAREWMLANPVLTPPSSNLVFPITSVS